ncbi:RNA polymerase sigma-70 factor (sigma-E family) [Lentzea atacamensis]|uniref:RNA polymerase sigma-70 factor (Sigma-E family) n=1 Tax=Lentzea atacamensis TaxID=531938 RepID=A0A316IA30_9PSEU|nr:SigE family RNA polymerase sigma factor [Lentzea atacamensis]PWK90392.1 RNA polymerase sigma-70 factor (sigma-E family) [Lentzea atacamensis]
MDRDREFGEFVDARALVMRRTAYLLCGDWHRAEDIVQTALIKLYVAWSRVRKDSVDAYARKVLVRTAVDESRRGFFQRERTVDAVPEPAVTDNSADFDLRLALDALPPGQRAVVVLRYWEDLSITETARILGRTEGTVKSQAAKGLAALRDLLEDEPQLRIYRSEVIRKGKAKLTRRRTAIAGALSMVLLVGLGSTGYVLQSQVTMKDQGGSAVSGAVDRNVVLTQILRTSDVIPTGFAVEDVAEIQATAFEFRDRDSKRWAVARLRDAQGVGGVTIWLDREPRLSTGDCNDTINECHVYERNGIKVTIALMTLPGMTNQKVLLAEAWRPDGTHIQVTSDNVGRFDSRFWGKADLLGAAQRPEPVLDREELIKIATLPGLTH